MANEHIVNSYLERLQDALGKDAFGVVFAELSADKSVGQAEAVSIASKFVIPVADSTSKDKALASVMRRHKNLATFRLKQRAMRGKSAA